MANNYNNSKVTNRTLIKTIYWLKNINKTTQFAFILENVFATRRYTG